MGYIALQVLPIFCAILLGWMSQARGWIDAISVRALINFALWIAFPALLINAIPRSPLQGVAGVALVYFLGCAVLFLLAMVLARLLLGAGLSHAALFGLNATYGNIGALGIPTVLALFGPDALALIMPIIALHSGFFLPIAAVLIAIGAGGGNGYEALMDSLRSVARNPIVIAIAVGLMLQIGQVPIPEAVGRLLSLFGGAGPPIALFCIGASLPALAGNTSWREASLACTLKLAVMPLVVWIGARQLGIEGFPLQVAVIIAALPTGANVFLLAQRSSVPADASATTVAVATAVSVVTLSAWAKLVF